MLTIKYLQPTAPPRFTSKPPSLVSVKEGSNLSLSISASGNPAPKITWSLQERNHGNQSRYKITADKFEIRGVLFEDQGMITCRAENVFGLQEINVKLVVLGEFVVFCFDKLSGCRKIKPKINSSAVIHNIKQAAQEPNKTWSSMCSLCPARENVQPAGGAVKQLVSRRPRSQERVNLACPP